MKKTQYLEQLIPASVAIFANVPGHNKKVETFIESDPGLLTAQMLRALEKISLAAFQQYLDDPLFGPLISEMQNVVREFNELKKQQQKLEKVFKLGDSRTPEMATALMAVRVQVSKFRRRGEIARRFLAWCKQLPVFGFNSGNFFRKCKSYIRVRLSRVITDR